MKTMKLRQKLEMRGCPKLRHLSVFIILSLLSYSSFSFEHKVGNSRTPASAFDEEVLTVPVEIKSISQTLFAEDDAGVMKGVRDNLASWQETEDYAQKWDLKSTHLYNTPSIKEKKSYIAKNLLRYADKRFAGEMRNAEDGSTLKKVSEVEKNLRPNISVPVTRYVTVKFKARVLQGKAMMEVRNPWLDLNATVGFNGKARVVSKKDFNQTGTSTGVEYSVNDSVWVAFVDQEITKNIKAHISSTTLPSSNDADKKVELTATFPFNL
jgi:predicted transcriptional regulator